MIANSRNLTIIARQVNQENNARNNRTSGSATDNSFFGHSQKIEPKDEDSDKGDIIIEDSGVPQKIPKAVFTMESLEG